MHWFRKTLFFQVHHLGTSSKGSHSVSAQHSLGWSCCGGSSSSCRSCSSCSRCGWINASCSALCSASRLLLVRCKYHLQPFFLSLFSFDGLVDYLGETKPKQFTRWNSLYYIHFCAFTRKCFYIDLLLFTHLQRVSFPAFLLILVRQVHGGAGEPNFLAAGAQLVGHLTFHLGGVTI